MTNNFEAQKAALFTDPKPRPSFTSPERMS